MTASYQTNNMSFSLPTSRNAQENQDVLSWVMSCIAQCLAGIVEYLTKVP